MGPVVNFTQLTRRVRSRTIAGHPPLPPNPFPAHLATGVYSLGRNMAHSILVGLTYTHGKLRSQVAGIVSTH